MERFVVANEGVGRGRGRKKERKWHGRRTERHDQTKKTLVDTDVYFVQVIPM
jgi:hypothetical protein